MEKVYLLTVGDGSEGDEWQLINIYATKGRAKLAKKAYEEEQHRRYDGSIFHNRANDIEEWTLEG
jgi:hypothetical protein